MRNHCFGHPSGITRIPSFLVYAYSPDDIAARKDGAITLDRILILKVKSTFRIVFSRGCFSAPFGTYCQHCAERIQIVF